MKRPSENVSNDSKKRKCTDDFDCDRSSFIAYEEGDFGIIESVTVQNFMCHENLTLKFEPHMNFIIGRNGSGKSAILTAIILALGGKSSSTDRFTNIKGFIKSEKNNAKVEVVLRNGGSLPYKPELYGKKIIVVREFDKRGSSKYKIKSESGTICSNQRAELINILEAMGIMVDCPVCVLTQATSKRFLISKDAKSEKLFEFFYKGTGLEMLEEKYKHMNLLKEDSEADLHKKKQSLPDLEKEIKKWEKFLESSNRISDYKDELIWANVIAMEKEVQEREEAHKKIEEEFEDHKRDLEACKKSLVEKNSELEDFNKEKSELMVEMENNRKQLEELKAEHEVQASFHRRTRGTLHRLQSERKKLEDDIAGLEKCINEQKRRDERNLEEEDLKRQTAVQNLQDENFRLNDKLKTFEERINTKRNEQNNLEKSIENFRVEINQHKLELQNIDNSLISTRFAIKNKVNAFGEHTESVLRDIGNMKEKFKKLPVGPIGKFLEIKDPKWAVPVEYSIGDSFLNSFCVDNHQDFQLLRNILRKYYSNPPTIIVSRFESKMFDVQHGKVQSSYPSVLDMLEIDDYLVANCLIDQCMIEKKILVGDEEARKSLIRNPPKNCYEAYFMNCDRIRFNPFRLYSYWKRTKRSRLRAFGAEDLKNLEKDKEEKMARIKMLSDQIERLKNAKESLPKEIKELEGYIVDISSERRKNLMEITELQLKEETKDVNCLQEDLQPLHHSYEQKEEEIKQLSQILLESESKKLDVKKKINTLLAQLQSLDDDFQRLLTKISQVSKLKENFASGKRKYEIELKYKENKCKTDQTALKDLQGKLNLMLANAESICPRINTERSSEDISRLIDETKRVVETQSNCYGDDLHKRYEEKKKNLQRAEKELKTIEKYLTHIGEMLKVRNANFQKIRKNTELLIGLNFTTILSGNNYPGHLIFDQINRTLTIELTTNANDKPRKNHSSLSGGERSFVTIAFLLALWERTKMPFRILDEYDVFMDSSNRQLSVDLLCQKAREMSQTQFIFLSPLELTRMRSFDCIHIMKLAAPKRKGEDEENSPRKILS